MANFPMTHDEEIQIYIQCVDNARSLIRNATDQQVYGVPEFWATPAETLSVGAGDCEDFALLVNHFCEQQGVTNVQLAICRIAETGEPHVASVYNYGEFVADNRLVDVRPIEGRQDLLVDHVGRIDPDNIPKSRRQLPKNSS